MKEKIIKILESQFSVVEYEDPDTGFTESTTIDVLTTDEFPDIVDKLEILVNQEVEKRMAERMPSEEEKEAAEIMQHLKAYGMIHPVTAVKYSEGTHEDFIKRADEWIWRYRSRLTTQVTPQDTHQVQKEGGGE